MTSPNGRGPTTTTNPAGISGTDYGDDVDAEVVYLTSRALRRVGVTGTNALVATSPAGHVPVAALAAGMRLSFIPVATNTGAMTIAVDGIGAVAVVDHDGNALSAGQVRLGRPTEVEIYADGKARVVVGLAASSSATKQAVLLNQQLNAYGGTLTTGVDNVVPLNIIGNDSIGVTGSLPQFTLPAGTYDFTGSIIVSRVDAAMARLYNVTDGADVATVYGMSNRAPTTDLDNEISLLGRFTITAPKTFQVLLRVATTRASEGGGGAQESGGWFATNKLNYARIVIEEARGNVAGVTEKGDFTPAVYGATLAGVGTYTLQTGHYEKLGNIVFFDIALTYTGHTGTGELRISGLPYASGARRSAVSLNYSALTYTSAPQAYVEASSQYVALAQAASNAAVAAIAMDAAATIRVSGAYSIV